MKLLLKPNPNSNESTKAPPPPSSADLRRSDLHGLRFGIQRVATFIAVAFFMLTLSTPGWSQTDWICGTDIQEPEAEGGNERGANCSNSSTTWLDVYRKPGHWVPDDLTPLKTVLVNMVVPPSCTLLR